MRKHFLTRAYAASPWFSFLLLVSAPADAQTKNPFSVSGSLGATYEYYGLMTKPSGYSFFSARRPWNQVRFNLQPTLKFSKDFSIPVNFNFATTPTNYAGPYTGITHQNLWQFITNPMNNFGLNPTYKWAEFQLGTQYLKYSDLSTGDIGIFGGGVSLRPGIFRFKAFAGTSQQPINYVFGTTFPPGVIGAYKRNHWMVQTGVEKEASYRVLINIARGQDHYSMLTSPPPTLKPQEGVVVSLLLDKYFSKGWYIKSEAAQSTFSKDIYQATTPGFVSLKPFVEGRASTQQDYAADLSIGKKTPRFDIAYATKYIGSGFRTTGYPYLQTDHWDNTLNTRFSAWKNKINVVASGGWRTNNVSQTGLRSQQFIGNLNWFTQFNDRFNINLNYNNFGFTAASGTNPYGIKNVSNDFGIAPTYSWSNEKMMHLLSFNYNFSKYDERDVNSGAVTSNNTHTLLLSYLPTFFKKEIAPEISLLYFMNKMPGFHNNFFTATGGLGTPLLRKKMQLKGQLQYTIGHLNNYTPNNNLIASASLDYKITKKLTWSTYLSSNFFKYGNELLPQPALNGANYLETMARTGLRYKF